MPTATASVSMTGAEGSGGPGSKLAVNFEPLNSYLGFLCCKLPELFFLQHYEGQGTMSIY